MVPNTRPISWVKAALKDFNKFPDQAKDPCLLALTIAAEGGKSDLVKPWHGLGPGILEIALPFRGDAYRVVYALQIGEEIWVVHAFKKKSTHGIKTPKQDIDVIELRIRRLKEMMR